jgi:hypothetical protein
MSTKFSELTAISSVDEADVLPIVDVSASETKKVTIAQILARVASPFRMATIAMASAGTDVTASSDEYGCLILVLTGSFVSSQNLLLPDTDGSLFIVYNASSGARVAKISGGTGVSIASGASVLIFHDGSDYRALT